MKNAAMISAIARTLKSIADVQEVVDLIVEEAEVEEVEEVQEAVQEAVQETVQEAVRESKIINLCYIWSFFFYSIYHFDDFQEQLVTEQNANHVHQMILVQQDKYAAGTHVNQDMPATRNRFYWQLTTVGFSSCKITLHLIQPHNSLQTLFNSINILLAETWSWTHCLIFS